MDKILNINAKFCFCAAFLLFLSFSATSQRLSASYLAYIDRYKELAIRHQQEFGIPASITLAQGLLESRAGRSYLAQRGNNHFGIKCHNWQGQRVEFDDTLRHTCYRQYGSAEDSFLDHARFLKGKRYSRLYSLKVTDYKGWAQGLKDCGYAEDPAYPQKLTALIEQYELHKFDSNQPSVAKHETLEPDENIGHSNAVAESPERTILRSADKIHKIHRKWRLHYVKASEGDTFQSIATEFDIANEDLLDYNDATADMEIPAGTYIFLEKKQLQCHSKKWHKVKPGETLWQIAQQNGIRLRSLLSLNHLRVDAHLEPGTKLALH